MKSIDEAIEHALGVAEINENLAYEYERIEDYPGAGRCQLCAEEHRQLADWLKHYKRIIESGDCNVCDIKKVCIHKPKCGELVRYNCPHYRTEEEE